MALHNFIIINKTKLLSTNKYTHITPEDWNTISEGLHSLPVNDGRSTKSGIEIRNAYSEFFIGSGALPFQWEKAISNDF